jgi:hypothetical protein
LTEGSIKQKIIAAKCLTLFFQTTQEAVDDYIHQFMVQMSGLLSDSNLDLVKESWNVLDAMIKRIRKDDLDKYVTTARKGLKAAIQPLEHGDEVAAFNLPKGLTPLLNVFLQGLMTGEVDTREVSAVALGELVSRTAEMNLKPYVTQITGPLIRVIGDRIPPFVKTAILHTLGLLLSKVPSMLKPFLPQLQRTFVKCLSEVGSNQSMRSETARCLSLLIPLQTRLDPLVTELVQGIRVAEMEVKKSIWEALFGLLDGVKRESGRSLSDASYGNIKALIFESLLESGEYEVSKRIGSSKCLGSLCLSVSLDLAKEYILELTQNVEKRDWVELHGILLGLEGIMKYSKDVVSICGLTDEILTIVTSSLGSSKSQILEASVALAQQMVLQNVATTELVEALVKVSHPSTESTDARREAIICLKTLSKYNHKVFKRKLI